MLSAENIAELDLMGKEKGLSANKFAVMKLSEIAERNKKKRGHAGKQVASN